jgi:hypothetical protein
MGCFRVASGTPTTEPTVSVSQRDTPVSQPGNTQIEICFQDVGLDALASLLDSIHERNVTVPAGVRTDDPLSDNFSGTLGELVDALGLERS